MGTHTRMAGPSHARARVSWRPAAAAAPRCVQARSALLKECWTRWTRACPSVAHITPHTGAHTQVTHALATRSNSTQTRAAERNRLHAALARATRTCARMTAPTETVWLLRALASPHLAMRDHARKARGPCACAATASRPLILVASTLRCSHAEGRCNRAASAQARARSAPSVTRGRASSGARRARHTRPQARRRHAAHMLMQRHVCCARAHDTGT